MRNTFIRALADCARRDPRIFLITADLGYSVLEDFAREFPDRFLNVGVAEQNAVGVAAGLAMSGRTVFVYSIVPFATMRCFEQIRVDVAYAGANVKMVGVGAGLSYGPAGATHHSLEDIALMRALPGMTVLCPGDPVETYALVTQAAALAGPAYLRLGKGGEPMVHAESREIRIGQAVRLREGTDAVLLTTSNQLETGAKVAALLTDEGITLAHWSQHTIKPFDETPLRTAIAAGVPVITLEEHSRIGGLGSAAAEFLAEACAQAGLLRLGLADEYTHVVGSQAYLRRQLGLDPESLRTRIRGFLQGKV